MDSARPLIASLLSLVALATPSRARAFVFSPVGGHAGEADVSFRLSLGRGKVEPNSNPDAVQTAGFEVYTLGVGYTSGDHGPFQDVRFGLDATWFTSPAEVSDLRLAPVSASQCLGTVTGEGRCQFHPAQTGWLLTPSVSANLIHAPAFSFGLFLQGGFRSGVDLRKFSLPRVDALAFGAQLGLHLTSWLGFESRTFVGLGARSGDARQNGAISSTDLLVFEARRWLLPWRAGVKLGVFFEGDLTERFDEAYDAAYTAGYPRRRDRIRSLRFATVVLPYVTVTDHLAFEGGYVQKQFGYDPEATVFLYAGVRAAF